MRSAVDNYREDAIDSHHATASKVVIPGALHQIMVRVINKSTVDIMHLIQIFRLTGVYGLILLFLLISCRREEFHQGTLPEIPVPLAGANSPYDDYNSMGPPKLIQWSFPLYFSSNRATQGDSFDVESFFLKIQLDQRSGESSVSAAASDDYSIYSDIPSPWGTLNSPSNEFGPYYIFISSKERVYMFASDRNGMLDIFHAHYDTEKGLGPIQPSLALNSVADDAYPSRGPSNAFYFSSNRNGVYDIFSASVPTSENIMDFLGRPDPSVLSMDSINSVSDDKAPFVNGQLMVFASNRPDGFGGYDLWYSVQKPGGWSAPINFGPAINSAFDEFRPMVIDTIPDFTNDLMIFSSNRPGGEGGFDLYYVGIPRLQI